MFNSKTLKKAEKNLHSLRKDLKLVPKKRPYKPGCECRFMEYCTCSVLYRRNYEYTQIKSEIKEIGELRFCKNCDRCVEVKWNFCPYCGDTEKKTLEHSKCKNYGR